MQQERNILKINLALSDQPLYISVNEPQMSLDTIFQEAIGSLKEAGRNHEAQQLAQLYQDHQIFIGGRMVSKGTLFRDLNGETQNVNGENVNFAEVELLKQHTGGDK